MLGVLLQAVASTSDLLTEGVNIGLLQQGGGGGGSDDEVDYEYEFELGLVTLMVVTLLMESFMIGYYFHKWCVKY